MAAASLAMFLSHLETLMAPQRSFFQIVQRDTMSFSVPELVELFGKEGVKFLSIDAGHTILHACNDLSLARKFSCRAGSSHSTTICRGTGRGLPRGFTASWARRTAG